MTISLTEMTDLARALLNADLAVEEADKALKDAKERARVIREETIPNAMQELGITSMVLETGQTLKVAQEVYASIPAAQKSAAFKWLNDNGFGGLIKVSVEADFGKGEAEEAKELLQELTGRGLTTSFSEDVHAQTLKAFLKEQIAKGNEELPLDLFGARPVWTAKVTEPTKKKSK